LVSNGEFLAASRTCEENRNGAATGKSGKPASSGRGEIQSRKTGAYNADTLRDLSKISEINQKIFRQQTPRAMLNTAVNEIGEYLRVSRALAVIGSPGRPPDLAAEYCGPNMKAAPGAQVVFLLAQDRKSTR